MTRYTYASAITPLPPTVSTANGNLENPKSGKLYLQKRTRQGYTVYSSSVSFSATAGQRVQVTISSTTRRTGDDIREFVLSYSATGNIIDACQIATYPGYDPLTFLPTALPTTIYLDRDEHFALGVICLNESALPSGTNKLHGMRRMLGDTGKIVEYSLLTDTWNESRVQFFSNYVSASNSEGGCDRDLSLVESISLVESVIYGGGGESEGLGFWLTNDTGSTISKGTIAYIVATSPTFQTAPFVSEVTDSKNLSAMLDAAQALSITFKGYVDTLTGNLDTTGEGGTGTMAGIDEEVFYKAEPGSLILPKDLPDKSAYYYQIKANFNFNSVKLPSNAIISFSADFYPFNSTFSAIARILGDSIASTEKRRRIFPGQGLTATVGDGSGIVDGYTFYKLGASNVVGVQQNTGSQKVSINSNGFCSVVTTVPSTSALRAFISTVNGVGQVTNYLSSIALTNAFLLLVTVTYPTAIRSDYPDVIAGASDGNFNASSIRIFVKNLTTSQIFYWDFSPTPNVASDTFTIGSSAGTLASVLPTVSSPAFGLYQIQSLANSSITGTSIFTTANYQVCAALVFNNTITEISHSSDLGCILELESDSIAKVISKGGFGVVKTVTILTTSLAANATFLSPVTLGISAKIRKITASGVAWIRLYGNSTQRTADANRSINTAAPTQAGIALNVNTSSFYTQTLDAAWFENFDTTPGATGYLSIKNLSGSTVAISVTIEFVRFA